MNLNYWLMKSEPDVYSIGDLKKDGQTFWEVDSMWSFPLLL